MEKHIENDAKAVTALKGIANSGVTSRTTLQNLQVSLANCTEVILQTATKYRVLYEYVMKKRKEG